MIMTKYRIVEVNHYNHTDYIFQKRLFGFLFWINPFSNAWDGGEFGSFDEALERATNFIAQNNHKVTRKTVWEA